jgi:hypothetical protein
MKPESPAKVSFALFSYWAMRGLTILRERLICRLALHRRLDRSGPYEGLTISQPQLMVRGHRIASRGLDYDPLNLVIIIPNLHQELSTVNSLNSIKSKAVEGHKYL